MVDANNVESEDYYQSMYEVIFRANNVLNYIDIADENNQAKYAAEAKFLRAYAYFKLVRLFSDVPLVTSVVGPTDNEALFTRIPEAQVYEQIIEDLQEAVLKQINGQTIKIKDVATVQIGAADKTYTPINVIGKKKMYVYDESKKLLLL